MRTQLKPTKFGNFFTPRNLSHAPVVFFMCILILWFYRYKHILVWFDGHLSSTTLFARNTNILSLLVKIDRQHISSMEESLFFKRFFFLFLVICPMVIWLIQKEHLWVSIFLHASLVLAFYLYPQTVQV